MQLAQTPVWRQSEKLSSKIKIAMLKIKVAKKILTLKKFDKSLRAMENLEGPMAKILITFTFT